MQPIGLYIHIPFCIKKCGYCDFYSVCADENTMDAYTAAVINKVAEYREILTADTLYFGGGTPSVLGGDRIASIINFARPMLTADAEITVEANPGDNLDRFLAVCADSGVNRLSLGLQSANDNELRLLTRRHSVLDAERAVETSRKNGINNISLDLMLGIEGQTEKSLLHSVDFCSAMGAKHISAYILKIEDGTPFAARRDKMLLPDDDGAADLYLTAVDRLKQNGYEQYEISNFAKDGAYSRHNLKYWNCDQYIGIGPSAHSYFDRKRSYYERDLNSFIVGAEPVFDGYGGDFEEYAMLRLRLSDGLRRETVKRIYENGDELFDRMLIRAKKYVSMGYCEADEVRIALTGRGFLVSNSIICDLI